MENPLKNRWERRVSEMSEADWERYKTQDVMPEAWANGAVYNVFLWHVATGGRRPIIDQHAWRGYCYLTGRGVLCEFPADRGRASKLYGEYDQWFGSTIARGLKPRDLDKALMAFGQFCGRCPQVICHYHKIAPPLGHV